MGWEAEAVEMMKDTGWKVSKPGFECKQHFLLIM